MRRVLILIIGFALIVSLANMSWTDDSVKAKKFRSFDIHEKTELNWTLKASETATSNSFVPNSAMTLLGIAYDGVNGDSSHFKLHLDVKGVDGWNNSKKTKTITSDSTEFTWELTATYLAFSDSMRIRAEALGDCRVLDDIIIKLKFRGCEASQNY